MKRRIINPAQGELFTTTNDAAGQSGVIQELRDGRGRLSPTPTAEARDGAPPKLSAMARGELYKF